MSDSYLDIRPGETWQDAWRRKVWSDAWKGFEPDTPRDPTFHVGCGTLTLAAVVGVPAGYLIARDAITHNAGPFGAFAGFIAVMFGLGFLARRRQKGLRLGFGAVGRLVRDRALWGTTLLVGAATAALGPRMAAEMNEPVGEWVAALAILGLIVGFALGIVVHTVRRLLHGRVGRSAGGAQGRGRGAAGVRAELEREFLRLMKPELDAMMLGRVRREQAARAFVTGLVANAAESSPVALRSELRSAIEQEKLVIRERRKERGRPDPG